MMSEPAKTKDPKPKEQPRNPTREAEQFAQDEERKRGKIPQDVDLDDRRTSPHERKYSKL